MFNNSKSSSKGPISRDRKVRSREPLLSDDRKSVCTRVKKVSIV
jgi:hypothetical protein